jgi:peroxiredoxin family protein
MMAVNFVWGLSKEDGVRFLACSGSMDVFTAGNTGLGNIQEEDDNGKR